MQLSPGLIANKVLLKTKRKKGTMMYKKIRYPGLRSLKFKFELLIFKLWILSSYLVSALSIKLGESGYMVSQILF